MKERPQNRNIGAMPIEGLPKTLQPRIDGIALGSQLREWRYTQGLTQEELATFIIDKLAERGVDALGRTRNPQSVRTWIAALEVGRLAGPQLNDPKVQILTELAEIHTRERPAANIDREAMKFFRGLNPATVNEIKSILTGFDHLSPNSPFYPYSQRRLDELGMQISTAATGHMFLYEQETSPSPTHWAELLTDLAERTKDHKSTEERDVLIATCFPIHEWKRWWGNRDYPFAIYNNAKRIRQIVVLPKEDLLSTSPIQRKAIFDELIKMVAWGVEVRCGLAGTPEVTIEVEPNNETLEKKAIGWLLARNATNGIGLWNCTVIANQYVGMLENFSNSISRPVWSIYQNDIENASRLFRSLYQATDELKDATDVDLFAQRVEAWITQNAKMQETS